MSKSKNKSKKMVIVDFEAGRTHIMEKGYKQFKFPKGTVLPIRLLDSPAPSDNDGMIELPLDSEGTLDTRPNAYIFRECDIPFIVDHGGVNVPPEVNLFPLIFEHQLPVGLIIGTINGEVASMGWDGTFSADGAVIEVCTYD